MAISKKTTKNTSTKDRSVERLNFNILRRWNIWLAGVLALEFIAILILSTSKNYPVIGNFLGVNSVATQATGKLVLANGLQHLFDISLVWIVVLPLLIGAVTHWLMATYGRQNYESGLVTGVNRIRWADYALSSALIFLVLGLVLNVHSIATLIMLFAGGLVIGLFGSLAEQLDSDNSKSHALAHVGELVAGLAVWLTLAVQLFIWHTYGNNVGASETWLFFTILGLDILLLVNQYLAGKALYRWADHAFVDKSYMILGFVIKSALAWQVYAYFLHP